MPIISKGTVGIDIKTTPINADKIILIDSENNNEHAVTSLGQIVSATTVSIKTVGTGVNYDYPATQSGIESAISESISDETILVYDSISITTNFSIDKDIILKVPNEKVGNVTFLLIGGDIDEVTETFSLTLDGFIIDTDRNEIFNRLSKLVLKNCDVTEAQFNTRIYEFENCNFTNANRWSIRPDASAAPIQIDVKNTKISTHPSGTFFSTFPNGTLIFNYENLTILNDDPSYRFFATGTATSSTTVTINSKGGIHKLLKPITNTTVFDPFHSYFSGSWEVTQLDSALSRDFSNIVSFDGTTTSDISGTSSVFGRTGDVDAVSGDYDTDEIDETASRVFVSPTQKTAIDNAVPNTRTVNSKQLNSNIVLTPTDIGSEPALGFTPEDSANKSVSNGYASLDAGGKVPTSELPDSVLGSVQFQGTWNANTDTPTIPTASSGNLGHYYKVSVAGSTNIDGITDWKVGDWLASNGSSWDKIDNTENVSTVFGRTGAITANSGDYDADKIDETASRVFITPDQENRFDLTSCGSSTTLNDGGVISIASPSSVDITAGSGKIVDCYGTNNNFDEITWTAQSNVFLTNIGTENLTYLSINPSGNVEQRTEIWTPEQRRSEILLGVAIHSTGAISSIIQSPSNALDHPLSAIGDLTSAIGIINLEGNKYSGESGTLSINKSAGKLYSRNGNYRNNPKDPSSVTVPETLIFTFLPTWRDGSGGFISGDPTTLLVADRYDDGTVTASTTEPNGNMGVGDWTNHRIYMASDGLTIIHYGQEVYNSSSEALNARDTENFEVNPSLKGASFRGWISVKNNVTDLTNTSDAIFTHTGALGGGVGSSSSGTTDLQGAYNNSSSTEIITDITRGGLTLKNGSGTDTNNNLVIQNNAGSITGTWKGNGDLNLAGVYQMDGTTIIDSNKNLSNIGSIITSDKIQSSYSMAGDNALISIKNEDNANIASHSMLVATSGGASGGDPFTRYTVDTVLNWATGIDNSDGDKFKISRNPYLGTNDIITLDSSLIELHQPTTVTGELGATSIKVTGGSPGTGKVLTSDAVGLASWETPASGISDFDGLTDTPSNKTSSANKFVKVNGGESALEYSSVTSSDVGLGNVTNESKATMFSSPTFTGTVSGVTSTMVGLGNVTNESKATMFSSPTFTGTVTVAGPIKTGTATDLVLERNSITKLTLGDTLATFADRVSSNGITTSNDIRINKTGSSTVHSTWSTSQLGTGNMNSVITLAQTGNLSQGSMTIELANATGTKFDTSDTQFLFNKPIYLGVGTLESGGFITLKSAGTTVAEFQSDKLALYKDLEMQAGEFVKNANTTISGLPSSSSQTRGMIAFVNDGADGKMVYNDATNWRYIQTDAIV